jgi:hypothetical protein
MPAALDTTMRHDLESLVRRVEAAHRAASRICERRWTDELEKRRREIAAEYGALTIKL